MECIDCNIKMEVKREPYHYTECGVDNVYLLGINVYHCSKCGSLYPEISEPDLLHIVLAISFSMKKSPLTGQEIRFMRKEVGMTAKAFANELGVTAVSLSRWEGGHHSRRSLANDHHIRHVFELAMTHRLQTIMEWLETSIERAKIVHTSKTRIDIDTEQLQYFSIPTFLSKSNQAAV